MPKLKVTAKAQKKTGNIKQIGKVQKGQWGVAKKNPPSYGPQSLFNEREINTQNWWAPRLLRSGGVLVEAFFWKTVV